MRKLGLSLLWFLGALTLVSISMLRTGIKRAETIPERLETESVLGLPAIETEIIIDSYNYNGTALKVVVLPDINESMLDLYSNLDDSKTSVEILASTRCSALINGGFYTKENTQPGLFISDSNELHGFISNRTYNGIFSINTLGIPRITRRAPVDPLVTALQTGPLLIENGSIQNIEINNDKLARRMVLAITGSNEVVFLSIYNSQSAFSGPLLKDTPEIIQAVSETLSLGIADAINLDGGSASALYTSDFSLPEASIIGSYFCINN